jgi:O-antigen/teichoic acid export membrane protein
MLVSSSIFLVVVILLFSSYIAALLGYPQQVEYIIWFAFILGFDALSALPFALLRLEGKAMKFACVKLINLSIHLGFVVLFLYVFPKFLPQFYDANIGIGYVFMANLLASGSTFLLLMPTYRYPFESKRGPAGQTQGPSPVVDLQLLKKMLLYAFPLVLAGFAGIINEVLDRILLKIYLPGSPDEVLQQLGVYGACYKLAIFMNLFTQAFNYAAEPFFFRNAEKKYAKQLYADIAFLFTLIGTIGFLAIMLNMQLVQYFIGSNFREGLIIVPYLLVANLFLGLYYNVAVWFKINNQTKYGAYIALTGAAVTIVGNLVGIPLCLYLGLPGYLGAAWATLICYALMVLLCYYWGQRHYPIPYDIRRILAYILGAVLLYLFYVLCLQPLLGTNFWRIFIGSNCLLFVYVLTLFLLEKNRLKEMLKI